LQNLKYRQKTTEHYLLPGKTTEITGLLAFGEKLQDRQATGRRRRPKTHIERGVPQLFSGAKVLNTNWLDSVLRPDLLISTALRRHYYGTTTALLRHCSLGHRDAQGSSAVAVP
jgi:hypothetical protein